MKGLICAVRSRMKTVFHSELRALGASGKWSAHRPSRCLFGNVCVNAHAKIELLTPLSTVFDRAEK
ncbi:MAG TPA: hypothetical protein VGI18_00215, partial [Burkholderiales bacterium]